MMATDERITTGQTTATSISKGRFQQRCLHCGNITHGDTVEAALAAQQGHLCNPPGNPIVSANLSPRQVMLAKAADQCVKVKQEIYKLKEIVDAIPHAEQRADAQRIFHAAYDKVQELQTLVQSK